MLDGCSPLEWSVDPLEALLRLPGAALLHSGRLHDRWARWSVLAVPDAAYVHDDDGARWIGKDPPVLGIDPLANLDRLADDPDRLHLGMLSYDLGRLIESIPDRARRDRRWPLVHMQRCSGWAVHDGATARWHAGGSWRADPPTLGAAAQASFAAGDAAPCISPDQHRAAVAQAIELIRAGDIFEVNLAHRFTASFQGDPLGLFHALARRSPAWFGAYLPLLAGPGDPARTLCSTSPELFLRLEADGRVLTRPIKGTRPASASPSELLHSLKDQAELNMVVDMLRNDLGRVSRFGSVRVVEPRTIEAHPTVHHGVATVSAQLREGLGLGDLLRATMPGGSITGAPKVRAMQIIEQLEPVRRGPYCGAIGYILGGRAQFNIAIRTMLVEQEARGGPGRVDFSVGGGIVADSDPEAEYQETLAKAAAMRSALAGASRYAST